MGIIGVQQDRQELSIEQSLQGPADDAPNVIMRLVTCLLTWDCSLGSCQCTGHCRFSNKGPTAAVQLIVAQTSQGPRQ